MATITIDGPEIQIADSERLNVIQAADRAGVAFTLPALIFLGFELEISRVFLMAPLHHHFEMAGWSETKIIVRLWLIALIVGSIGFTLYFRSLHA
jgi:hypothetical protein